MSTYNYLPTNSFQLKIPELPLVSFYTQDTNLPSISIQQTIAAVPGIQAKLPGNSVDYTPLSVTFIVDELLNNYTELFKWVDGQRLDSPYSEKYGNLTVDATLHVTTANSTSNKFFTLTGLFPTQVGELQFRTTDSGTVYMTCNAVFEFNELKLA